MAPECKPPAHDVPVKPLNDVSYILRKSLRPCNRDRDRCVHQKDMMFRLVLVVENRDGIAYTDNDMSPRNTDQSHGH